MTAATATAELAAIDAARHEFQAFVAGWSGRHRGDWRVALRFADDDPLGRFLDQYFEDRRDAALSALATADEGDALWP